MAIEGFVQQQEDAIHGPTPEIPASRGMDEFLLDDAKSKLFDFYLKAMNPSGGTPSPEEEAWKRYKSSEPKEADEALLQTQFEDFKSRLERYDKVWATITKFKNGMLAHSPVFQRFNKFKGTANIARVLEHGLRDMALVSDDFKDVEAEVEKLLEQQRKEAELDKKMNDFAAKHGVEDEKLKQIMANPNEYMRQEQLSMLLESKLSFGGKLLNILTRRTGKQAKELSPDSVHQLVADRRSTLAAAGDYMKTLLVSRDDLRNAMARIHNGERIAFPNGSEVVMPLSETREKVKELDKKEMVKRAKVFRELHKDKNWDDPAVAQQLQEEFAVLEEEKIESFKKTSFFARVLTAIKQLVDPRADAEIKKILDK